MAAWQYNAKTDRTPLFNTEKGYAVSLPSHAEGHYNVELEFDENVLRLWIHEVILGFQINGSFAQSSYYREWYPRNMVQPSIRLVGQTANEHQYGEVAEFLRKSQLYALQTADARGGGNTLAVTIPQGGIQDHFHMGHHFRGHVKRVERRAERFNNRPEFSIEFVVVNAYSGLLEVKSSSAEAVKGEFAMYMQIPNTIRRGATVEFSTDPDRTG
jgi:hypothetical protein